MRYTGKSKALEQDRLVLNLVLPFTTLCDPNKLLNVFQTIFYLSGKKIYSVVVVKMQGDEEKMHSSGPDVVDDP